MTGYRDLLFFVPAGLAILFMLWVLLKFTQQLAGPGKSARPARSESRLPHVGPANKQRSARISAQD